MNRNQLENKAGRTISLPLIVYIKLFL